MSLFYAFIASMADDEVGQGLTEYALIISLIAVVAIVALLFLGGSVSTLLSSVGTSL
jgi:Flp pilus assembly pilin Flp